MLSTKFSDFSFVHIKSLFASILLRPICNMSSNTIYQFTVKDENQKDVSLEKYKGKVVVIVNVASKCGYTENHYVQLKEILDKYKSQNFEVACFPCNQFNSQEPGCAIDVHQNIKAKYNFEPDFYDKIDVNGNNADPLYKFLKKEQGGTLFDAIKWNFTKFLVNRSGHVIKRYGPNTEPKAMIQDIEKALAE